MFGFMKPKRSAEDLGRSFAEGMPKLLLDTTNEKVVQQIAGMVSKGANAERIRSELAAFLCFCSWAGMAAALQNGKIAEAKFDILNNAFFNHLETLAGAVSVDLAPSLSYSTFWEWLKARIDRYIGISTAYGAKEVNTRLIDNFCDFACDGEPTTKLKLELLQTYLLSSAGIYDILSSVRLV
jgi:hypothetical protein